MALIPSATEELIDPGLGVGEAAGTLYIFVGVCSAGPVDTLQWFSSPAKLSQERGVGPVVEAASYILNNVGGPVGVVRVDASVAAANGAITKSSTGPTITVNSVATLDAFVRVVITLGGALGTARFKYCLDGFSGDSESDRTYSEELVVPAGGTFAIPGLGTTITFPSGTYVLGENYTWSASCAGFNSTDLADAFASIAASTTEWRGAIVITSAGCGNATAHATLAAALQSQLNTLAAGSEYRRGMIMATADLTDTAATVNTAFASLVAPRLCIPFGTFRRISKVPFVGHAAPRRPAIDAFALRAAGSKPSTDLKRVRGNGLKDGGALPDVLRLFNDERVDATNLDSIKISTLRTWKGRPGFYITQARLKSATGSDFTHWHRGVVMDIACEVTHAKQVEFVGSGFRVNSDGTGTIYGPDAIQLEEEVKAELAARLLQPTSAEGTPGYVSGIAYAVDRTVNYLATETIVGEVGVLPRGTTSYLNTRIGYTNRLPGEQPSA